MLKQKNIKISENEKAILLFRQYGYYAILATCFSIPISTTLTTAIFPTMAILCWLGSRGVQTSLYIIHRSNFVAVSLVLFTTLIVGTTYSIAPVEITLGSLKKYLVLIYPLMVVYLCAGRTESHKDATNAFIAGATIAVIASFLMSYNIIAANPNKPHLIQAIEHNGLIAFLCYLLLRKVICKEKYWPIWLTAFLFSAFDIFYVVDSRTGQLIFFFLILLLAAQHFSIKKSLLAIASLIVLSFTVYSTSPNFANKFDKAITNYTNYHGSKEETVRNSSVGLRIGWWLECIELTYQKPLTGFGTGSFIEARKKIESRNKEKADHPHNEYLFILEQVGVLGFILFLLLLFIPLDKARKMEVQVKHTLQAIVLTMTIGCVFNSWLFDAMTSHFYIFLTSVFIGTDKRIS